MASGLTYIGVIIFTITFFGVFTSLYMESEIIYTESEDVTILYNASTGTVYAGDEDTSAINKLKSSIDLGNAGVFGNIIEGAIFLFIGFIALYYARGTN